MTSDSVGGVLVIIGRISVQLVDKLEISLFLDDRLPCLLQVVIRLSLVLNHSLLDSDAGVS